jgi:hypothetical protein
MKNDHLHNITLFHHVACHRNVTDAFEIGHLSQNKTLQWDQRIFRGTMNPYRYQDWASIISWSLYFSIE